MRRHGFGAALGTLACALLLAQTAWAADPSLERVEGPAFRRVCDAVRTEGSVRFEGDEVQRGRARADFRRHREDVLAQVYTADVPAPGFAFGEYDFTGRKLPLDLGRSLRPTEGVELSPPARSDEDFEFGLQPDAAQGVVSARAAGKLRLRVTFRLAASAELPDPCVRLGGGRSLKVRVDPLAFELIPDGRGGALARVESPRYRDAISELTPVARPHVQVAKTSDLQDAALLHALEGQLLGCYKAGLAKNARLRGSVVIGLTMDREGRVEGARPEIDAIGDDALVGCAMERLRAQRFPKGRPHLSIPVFFQSGD